jgi:hypothetical protein
MTPYQFLITLLLLITLTTNYTLNNKIEAYNRKFDKLIFQIGKMQTLTNEMRIEVAETPVTIGPNVYKVPHDF